MRVAPLLFLLFVAIPPIEIALFVVVGGRIGIVATMAIVVITAFIGAALVSRQSRSEWVRVQQDFFNGVFPGRSLAHGAMILIAGALLITPGFLTDTVGFALLVPPIREALRRWALRRYGGGPTPL